MKLSGNDLVTTAPPPLRSVNQNILIGQDIGSPVRLRAVFPRGYANERRRTEFREELATVHRLSTSRYRKQIAGENLQIKLHNLEA